MTPDKRLNQLEPVVADIAQKQDRMISQMGSMAGEIAIVKSDVVETKTNTAQLKTDIIRIEKKVDTTATGLANLTIEMRQGFDRSENRLDSVENRLNSIEDEVSTLRTDVSILQTDVAIIKTDVSEIKQTQNLILKILQERLM